MGPMELEIFCSYPTKKAQYLDSIIRHVTALEKNIEPFS